MASLLRQPGICTLGGALCAEVYFVAPPKNIFKTLLYSPFIHVNTAKQGERIMLESTPDRANYAQAAKIKNLNHQIVARKARLADQAVPAPRSARLW